MIKKIICLTITFLLLFSLVACNNEERKILKQFDLSEPKELWTGTIDDDFGDDRILIVMRRTSTFPKLELHHFKLDNAESIAYIALRPHESDMENEDYLAGFRQIAIIHLKQHGKEKVVEAIKQLEKLAFIRSAEPSSFDDPE